MIDKDILHDLIALARAIVTLAAVLVVVLHGIDGQHKGGVDVDDVTGAAGVGSLLQYAWTGWRSRNT